MCERVLGQRLSCMYVICDMYVMCYVMLCYVMLCYVLGY